MNTKYRQNGRDVANAERGALRKWLVLTADVRSAGPSDSDEYASAREESRDGYVERGGSANTFKTKMSRCNIVLDHFTEMDAESIARKWASVDAAWTATKSHDAAGNPIAADDLVTATVTVKGPDERRADAVAAMRRWLGTCPDLNDADILAAWKDAQG